MRATVSWPSRNDLWGGADVGPGAGIHRVRAGSPTAVPPSRCALIRDVTDQWQMLTSCEPRTPSRTSRIGCSQLCVVGTNAMLPLTIFF